MHKLVFSAYSLFLQSREGVSLVVQLLRQSRLQPMTLGGPEHASVSLALPAQPTVEHHTSTGTDEAHTAIPRPQNSWSRLKSWLRPPPRAD
jgi:hypothetical protein